MALDIFYGVICRFFFKGKKKENGQRHTYHRMKTTRT